MVILERNLYEEITVDLRDNGKSWDDVLHVYTTIEKEEGNDIVEISQEIDKELFIKKAKKITYEWGSAKAEINRELKIVGDGWWLERFECSGVEHFEYKELYDRKAERIYDLKAELRGERAGVTTEDAQIGDDD